MPRYQRTFRAMGSTFLVCIDTVLEPAYVGELFQKVQQRTEQLELVMSRFRADSELVLVNQRVVRPARISSTLQEVLLLAETFMDMSGGAFDPRILTGLEQIGYHGAPLSDGQVKSLDSGGDPRQLFHQVGSHGTICLHRPIDLGGIGKGFTSDSLADLIEASVDMEMRSGYLVDAGGDIVIAGHQENGDGWSIGIEDPYGTFDELAAVIQFPTVPDRIAMCTSSLKRQSWVYDGKPVHHLLDPASRTPADTRFRAVTAVGPTAAYAEVFTKCKMISTVSDGTCNYSWQGTPLPYLAIDLGQTLCYTTDLEPLLVWISSKYENAQVLSS